MAARNSRLARLTTGEAHIQMQCVVISVSEGGIDVCSHKDIAASVGGEEYKLFEEERFDFWWTHVDPFLYPRSLEVRAGVRFRPVSILQENPNWGCCLTQGDSPTALCLSSCTSPRTFTLLCVVSATVMKMNPTSRGFSLLLSVFTALWEGAMHDGYVPLTPHSPTQPTPFPLRGFWVGTILFNWSLWAPSTHPTVGWTESPLRRQLLGLPGQAGRTGRGGGGLEALLLEPLPPHPHPTPLQSPSSGSQVSTSVEILRPAVHLRVRDVFPFLSNAIKKILQSCTRSRRSTADSFHVAFKEPLHFMKRAVISWPALVVWTAVFLCLFFLFQQAGEDKHTRVGNHAYIHSHSMTWTLDTANEWLLPIKLNWWVIKSCSNQKLVSVFCRAAWYCYRLLYSPAWAAKQPFFFFSSFFWGRKSNLLSFVTGVNWRVN